VKLLKICLGVLLLAMISCRSVPSEVSAAHDTTIQESQQVFIIAESLLNKIALKSEELNSDVAYDSYVAWKEHIIKLSEARAIVAFYLTKTKAGPDVTKPYAVAEQLLTDMHNGFITMVQHWEEMLRPDREVDANEFIQAFRRDIERYRILEHKFNEWIKQFKVKG